MTFFTKAVVGTAVLLAPLSSAWAQEAVDIGVIHDSDVRVVQKLLYPKEKRWELGFALGVMPADAYTVAPNFQFMFNQHFSDTISLSIVAGGGYGLTTRTYSRMEELSLSVPDAYRYLASLIGGVEWAPIYAKMNLNGAKVVHFDVYLAGRVGVVLEQSVTPEGSMALSPTVSPGLGTRFYTSARTAVRFEVRDDLMVQYRSKTSDWNFKQNVNVTVGFELLAPVKTRRR